MTGTCPGCGRTDVRLLRPRPPSTWRVSLPWRRKAHATRGDLQSTDAVRCRWPVALTPDETPEEP